MNIFDRMRMYARAGATPPAAAPATPAPFTLERGEDDSATLTLYGDIVSERPTDWYGNPVEGQFIILKDVMEQLSQVQDVSTLRVMIHSCGGDAFDSIAIHNKLKSMKARVEVTVDGVAMSGGSLIMCAGDNVQVFPSSIVMIHRCWGFLFGGYNATELRKTAESYEALDRSQAAIYHSKTGLEADELLDMMDAETYMVGQEAVDKGFADSIAEGDGMQVAASADRKTLFVGSLPVWVTDREGGIPSALKLPTISSGVIPAENKTAPAVKKAGAENGGKTMAKTLEELRAENPELAEQLMAEAKASVASAAAAPASQGEEPSAPDADAAVQAERDRIREIDALASLYDAETITAAKYGEHPCTAQEMAYQAAMKAAKQGKNFLADLEKDAKDSKAGEVKASNHGEEPVGEMTPEQRMAQGRADAKALNTQKKEEK